MPLKSLLELIPPPAVYRRIALDPRLNALGPWQEATQAFVAPEDQDGVWAGLVYAPPSAPRISPEQASLAREALRQNAACLDALDRGLERVNSNSANSKRWNRLRPIRTSFPG